MPLHNRLKEYRARYRLSQTELGNLADELPDRTVVTSV